MMATLVRAWLIGLKRDRVALLLTFALPILFFTILSIVFAGTGGGTGAVKIAVVDEDGSEASRRLVDALRREGSLEVQTEAAPDTPDAPARALDRAAASELVETGNRPIAVIIPKGFGATFGTFSGDGPAVEVLADTSDKVAPQMVSGLLQGIAMTAAPDLMMQHGLEMFERFGGAMTPSQRAAVDTWMPMLRQSASTSGAATATETDDAGAAAPAAEAQSASGIRGPVSIKVVDVLGDKKKSQQAALISVTAAGTAVMFLLFSASGAGGTLLEEQESGVLERLLSTKLTMGRLLVYKWGYLAAIGFVQVSIMFAWGTVMGLDLWSHIGGFALITAATASAGAAFALVLATACRSRAQLGGISTIVILTMSAIGGSMMPRIFMSETMKQVGYVTFNAWALDGYYKVFWYEQSAAALWPQVAVLAAATGVFLLVARRLARRWEVV